jgi:polar amino acid transport system substrate-binding protein
MTQVSSRRHFGACLLALLAGCATTVPPVAPDARAALAPGGVLRIGVYPGSPTSLVHGPGAGEMRGLTVDLGRDIARRLGARAEIVVFDRVAQVLDGLQAGSVDLTITNATPARAALVDFTRPVVALELGYLALAGSPVQDIAAVDRAGVRVGVSEGSSSQATLSKAFTQATLVTAPSLQAAKALLVERRADVYATNKGILHEMAAGLPGARVLDGRWGLEHLAIAIPKGRDAGRPALQALADALQAEGAVQRAAERAGLRGTVAPEMR